MGLCCTQAHTLLFMVVYALILILPYTKWRDRLPAKPSFYRYIVVLFTVNLLAALGNLCSLTLVYLKSAGSSDLQKKWQDGSLKAPAMSLHMRPVLEGAVEDKAVSAGAILLGSEIGAGYCVYGLANFLYYSIYPPVRSLQLTPCLHNPCVSSRCIACVLVPVLTQSLCGAAPVHNVPGRVLLGR